MDRYSRLGIACAFVLTTVLFQPATTAETQGAPPEDPNQAAAWNRPEIIVLGALRANPVTAPYAILTSWKKNAVVLSGRVGTTAIHDIAVRTVIDLGYPVRDELVIDTGEAHRVALSQTAQLPWAAGPWGNTAGSAPYVVYPPPLFGRVDDPFFGFEPPLVSFPPWAAARGMDSQMRAASIAQNQGAAGQPGAGAVMPGPGFAPSMQAPAPADHGQVKGKLELTVDMSGQVFLTGVVASEEDRRIIEEEARNTPGVSRVFSNLQVATQVPAQAASETPPPPPQPYVSPEPGAKPAVPTPSVLPQQPQPEHRSQPQPRPQPQPAPAVTPQQPRAQAPVRPAALAMAHDTHKLTRRVTDAMGRRSTLAALPISIQSHGDVVTLSGTVPSAYEAMLAYRTVEQTPGVRDIIDQLQFQLPDENHPNPLKQKARPDDLEPYLVTQIRRHLGEIAHVDVVRVRGDVVEIRGTVADPQDQERVKAILRSMPLLRDFRLEPVLVSE
jgi:BON domain